jgi:hypothetical protein
MIMFDVNISYVRAVVSVGVGQGSIRVSVIVNRSVAEMPVGGNILGLGARSRAMFMVRQLRVGNGMLMLSDVTYRQISVMNVPFIGGWSVVFRVRRPGISTIDPIMIVLRDITVHGADTDNFTRVMLVVEDIAVSCFSPNHM